MSLKASRDSAAVSLEKAGNTGLLPEGLRGDFSRDAAPVWVFSRGTTASSGSHSCGAREVG